MISATHLATLSGAYFRNPLDAVITHITLPLRYRTGSPELERAQFRDCAEA